MHTFFCHMPAYLSRLRFYMLASEGIFFKILCCILSHVHAQCPQIVNKLILMCPPSLEFLCLHFFSDLSIDKQTCIFHC